MKRIGILVAVLALGAFGCASSPKQDDTKPKIEEDKQDDMDVVDDSTDTPDEPTDEKEEEEKKADGTEGDAPAEEGANQ